MNVVELQTQDDLASLRYRLGRVEGEYAVLVLPWDIHFLSRELDFEILRREVERWQLEVAIVSADPERRQLARTCGFPAFTSVEKAQHAQVWRSSPPAQVEPPPRHWWEEPINLRPRPLRPHAQWASWVALGGRAAIFFLSLAVVAGSACFIVPNAEVTLVPAGREFTVIVPVSVDLDAESVDHATHVIPARRVGDEFEGYAEVETTGLMNVISGRATGEVLFTNLLMQDYVVSAGTVVRTSSTSYPLRFRTTADVVIPAAGRATVPIEALGQGVGNVGAFQINQVEGVAASAVRVTNPSATTGAELVEARVVAQADYDRLHRLLMRQLLDQAHAELTDSYLESTEILLRQSLRIEAVPKQAYTHFVTEQADEVGLDMRLLIRGWVVDVGDANAVAYAFLSRRIPEGYKLVSTDFEIGEVAEEDVGPGQFTFFVTACGYAAAALDADATVSLIRGRRLSEARERLLAELPLAEEPQFAVWPKWMDRLPLLPLRIDVRVVPRGHAVGQASSVTNAER